MEEFKFFVNTFLQMFALLSPFGVAVFFASNTSSFDLAAKRQTAKIAIITITLATIMVFLFGNLCLKLFGITLDAFRIGTGTVLMLNSISIVRGTKFYEVNVSSPADFAIVPFAIPFVVGPGIIGYLIVLSVDTVGVNRTSIVLLSLLIAIAIMAILIWNCDKVSGFIGKRKMAVIDRLYGLILCCMAAQIIFVGIRNFLVR